LEQASGVYAKFRQPLDTRLFRLIKLGKRIFEITAFLA
jgi:hypothetical protein